MTGVKQPAADLTPAFRRLLEALPLALLALFRRRPGLFLWLRVALLLGLFVALDYVIARATHLSAQSYGRPYLFLELLARLGALKLSLALIVLAVLVRYGRLLQPWGALEFGGRLRWFIVFLAALLAWPFSTYGYNFYFDQGHYADRALLVVLLALVWLRPVFIYPFVLLAYAVMWQLAEPVSIGGSVFAHKLQVLHVLNLFAAAFLLYAATGWNKTRDFLFLTCCLVAAAYWEAGLTKLKIDWLSYGHLYRLPLAAYAHGWLGFLDPEAVLGFARLLVWIDWPMRLIVLAIELGCLFFLWRRPLSAALLVAVVIFHAGVFALYGFLFWTWMLLDLALLVLLLRERRAERLGIYGRPQLLLSVLLIAAAAVWARPPQLGWFDTRLSYTYRFEAVGASGRHYPLPAQFFAPYEDAFTIAAFRLFGSAARRADRALCRDQKPRAGRADRHGDHP